MAGSDAAEALKEFIGDLIDGLRRSHRRDVFIGCCVAAVVSVLIAKAMVLSDIRRLEEKIDGVRVAMEASDRSKSVEASGNTVTIGNGINPVGELARQILVKKGLIYGDLPRTVESEGCSEHSSGRVRSGSGGS